MQAAIVYHVVMDKEPDIEVFCNMVWEHYRAHGRHDLPWRKTKDPYHILVSEVMLQQTQVPRVLQKYKEFLRAFPTVRALADASLADVLRVWNGMGYNRRAKFLRETAIAIVEEHGGRVPSTSPALRSLPGIGPYTEGAIRIFAFNLPDTMIETNIRAALIHQFFPHTPRVRDRAILVYAGKAAKDQDPRQWHWALMDYGAHIKKLHGNPARKSAHHAKQSKFEGSLRQVRGAILRALSGGESLLKVRLLSPEKFEQALAGLARDGLIKKERGKWGIA